jgi:hypothetical protein
MLLAIETAKGALANSYVTFDQHVAGPRLDNSVDRQRR